MKNALIYVHGLFQSCIISPCFEKKSESSGGAHLCQLCRQFSLAEIKAATNNFDESLLIGRRHPHIVYKGFIDNGTVTVAVKRLSTPCAVEMAMFTDVVFKNEVRFHCQLRHPNIVSLIGFCNEGTEAILVYEFMSNFSLDRYVNEPLKPSGRDPLSWEQRLRICIEVAGALHYLHAGVKYAIIHGHVKSTMVLLDENWSSKITDFGLSKLGPHSMSKNSIEVNSTIRGTIGYMDPMFIVTGQLTEKSDVYSFGVLLLEVLSSRSVFDHKKEEDQRSLIQYARKCIEKGSINQIIDTYLEGRIAPESLEKFVEIACECVCMDGRDRPSMGEVEVTLKLALELQEKSLLH